MYSNANILHLDLAVGILEKNAIAYAVCGSSAVFQYIRQHDESGVRKTQVLELLLAESDVVRANTCLSPHLSVKVLNSAAIAGGYRSLARPWPQVVVEVSGQAIMGCRTEKNPSVDASENIGGYRVLSLEPLVRMKLARYSLNDRVDLRDMLDVELLDASWPVRFPAELADRLQHLIDTPDG